MPSLKLALLPTVQVLLNFIPLTFTSEQHVTTPDILGATEQFIAGGIAMVIDSNKLSSTQPVKNYSATDILELRQTITPEAQLYREIMKNYDKMTRPVFNASHIVHINLNFTFSQVLKVEEKEQSMSVILWMDHFWYDEKLVWRPKDYSGIEELKIPSSAIWLPDIVLYNTAEERIIKTSSTNTGSRAYLKYTGEIYWPPIKRYTSSCNIDITYFPFDDQICHLKLGSWAYDGDQVNVWNPMNEMDMSQALKNSEFEVVDSKIRRFITYYRCCVEPFPDIKVYIHIRRQTIQHVFNIVIPCITLSIICMVGFLIPPDKNDEKISVQLTVLFSLSLFMLLVAESTPRTSETVPLISIYLTALMCITAMSTTAHVVADKLVASPRIRKEVPYLVNKLIYKLSLCCNDRKKKAENIELRNLTSNGSTRATTEVKQQQNGGITEIADDGKSPSAPVSKSQTKTKSSPEKKSSNVKSKQQTKTKESVEPAMGNTEKGLQDLFFHLKQRHDKVRLDLQDTAKWYKVATKMDRIFFWSYGFSVTILTFYAFVFKPMQKDISLYENI